MRLLVRRTLRTIRLGAPLALSSIVLLAASPALSAELLEPKAHHPPLGFAVAGTLANYHYDGHAIDDTVSALWMDSLLDRLDGGHLYFRASDVEEFQALSSGMDDDIRRVDPTLAVAFTLYQRYQERVEQGYAVANEVFDSEVTFADEKAVWRFERDDVAWPADEAAWRAQWQLRTKVQILDMMLGGKTQGQAKEVLRKRNARSLKYVSGLESDDIVESYLTALAEVYDPHSAYFKPSTEEDFNIRMADSLEGIGAELTTEDEYTQIKKLIAGGPAEASGALKSGDLIVAVAQGDGEAVDVVDMRLDHVVKLIRGSKGTEVRLTIRPSGATDSSATKVVSIIRDKVVLERASAKAEMHDVKQGDGAVKVGVIAVPSFYVDWAARRAGKTDYRSTTRDTERLIGELRDQGMQTLVIDLRGNGGGSLMESVSMTGLFIDAGPVVQIHDPNMGVDVLKDKDRGVAWSGPLVVLTDELSASASEIFAGAVQDYGRGLIVGSETTHGKGTVQSVVDMGEVLRNSDWSKKAGALKLTVQKFYRVTGGSTQHRGVRADVVLPSPWAGLDVRESDLDHALPWDEISGARVTRARSLNVDLTALQVTSSKRVAADEVFGWLAEDRAERDAKRKQGTVSLHWDTRKAEREQAEADVKARKLWVKSKRQELFVQLSVDDGPSPGETPKTEKDLLDQLGLGDVLDDAILRESLQVSAEFSGTWTPDSALIDADHSGKTADRERQESAQSDDE
ncbi:MAG: carboxyl-terminal processing protease [Kiritimatiellia bacterium]|jgi:carboxyl-terminal processing protease